MMMGGKGLSRMQRLQVPTMAPFWLVYPAVVVPNFLYKQGSILLGVTFKPAWHFAKYALTARAGILRVLCLLTYDGTGTNINSLYDPEVGRNAVMLIQHGIAWLKPKQYLYDMPRIAIRALVHRQGDGQERDLPQTAKL